MSGSAGPQQLDGMFSAIIPRNSTIPISRTETYATTAENQRKVVVRVFQGDARLVKNNVFLAEYGVEGVPPGPAGREKVAITFAYDINGILKVTTKVVSTGKEPRSPSTRTPARLSGDERSAARERLDRGVGGGARRLLREARWERRPDLRPRRETRPGPQRSWGTPRDPWPGWGTRPDLRPRRRTPPDGRPHPPGPKLLRSSRRPGARMATAEGAMAARLGDSRDAPGGRRGER